MTEAASIVVALILVPLVVKLLTARTRWAPLRAVPSVLWIMGLGAVLSSVGIVPRRSPTYAQLGDVAVPFVVAMTCIGLDARAVVRVRPRVLAAWSMGILGVVAGALLAAALFGRALGPGAWAAFGALSASWVGGTANLAAVARAVELPPHLFSAVVLIDVALYAVWISGLVAIGPRRGDATDDGPASTATITASRSTTQWTHTALVIVAGVCVVLLSAGVSRWGAVDGRRGPVQLVVATALGLALSSARLRGARSAAPIGAFVLHVYLASLGAQADLRAIVGQPVLVAAGVLCLLVHGLFCWLGMRLWRVDRATAAVASAANIGGTAAVTLVATRHAPALVPAGLLLVVCGSVVGNYVGLATASLCRWLIG